MNDTIIEVIDTITLNGRPVDICVIGYATAGKWEWFVERRDQRTNRCIDPDFAVEEGFWTISEAYEHAHALAN